jgi:hypothetical protein
MIVDGPDYHYFISSGTAGNANAVMLEGTQGGTSLMFMA